MMEKRLEREVEKSYSQARYMDTRYDEVYIP